MMVKIQLNGNEWIYNPEAQLGEGGFASVFEGIDSNGQPIVVKTFHISNSTLISRELEIANSLMSRPTQHVMPILDAGIDSNSGEYFIVMPRATKSLQDELNSKGKFGEKEALGLLLEIASGLNEVSDITHRDLKPDNILFYEGKWKVADFGIARFVANQTSANTLKGYLTAPYAAPEQWRLERSTSKTDIYALGCIGYDLLTGSPPFNGPDFEDYQEQHLISSPPNLTDVQPQTRTILASMLHKQPENRPELDMVIRMLSKVVAYVTSNQKTSLLAQVGAMDMEASLIAETERAKENLEKRKRKEIALSAFKILYDILDELAEKICEDVPTAKRVNFGDPLIKMQVKFKNCNLVVLEGANTPISPEAFKESGWDVICSAIIRVIQHEPRYEWSANLWYTNLGKGSNYRWYEVMYFESRFGVRKHQYEPLALDNYSHADLAASKVMHVYSLAAQPRPIDYENIEEFYERWMDLLAKAYKGELRRPSRLPLD